MGDCTPLLHRLPSKEVCAKAGTKVAVTSAKSRYDGSPTKEFIQAAMWCRIWMSRRMQAAEVQLKQREAERKFLVTPCASVDGEVRQCWGGEMDR